MKWRWGWRLFSGCRQRVERFGRGGYTGFVRSRDLNGRENEALKKYLYPHVPAGDDGNDVVWGCGYFCFANRGRKYELSVLERERQGVIEFAEVVASEDEFEVTRIKGGQENRIRSSRHHSETAIVTGDELEKKQVCLFKGSDTIAAQILNEAVLQGSPKFLDTPLGLRGAGNNEGAADLVESASELRFFLSQASKFLIQGEFLLMFGIVDEDRTAVGVEFSRETDRAVHLAHEIAIAVEGFFAVQV